jgi:hypothetical protein
MSQKLLSLNPDLKRLQDEGYDVDVRNGFLVINSVPYVNARREVQIGCLVTDLTLNGDRTQQPGDHQVWFTGEFPCKQDGTLIAALGTNSARQTLYDGLQVDHRFSCKPPEGYKDYHEKMTRYVEIISAQATAIDPKASPRLYKPIVGTEETTVFVYTDSAASRAGIADLSRKLAKGKIAIIGLGGTGSYVLDMVAKTHVKEIHLFDGDQFLQHNAFRAPGAASLDDLKQGLSKVAYYARTYSQMRRGIVAHEQYLDADNVGQLSGFEFVFVCVDKPRVRKLVAEFLRDEKIPFVDAGMELRLVEEDACLIGTCRVTLGTPDKTDHLERNISFAEGHVDNLYASNVQVADMNSLNAAMAVIKWKKYCGFYQDCYKEHQSAYAINAHQLTRDERPEAILE